MDPEELVTEGKKKQREKDRIMFGTTKKMHGQSLSPKKIRIKSLARASHI